MDIIITVPQTIPWEEYEKELKTVRDESQQMFFKVPFLPKKTNVGDRCYVCYRGAVLGYMFISHLGYINGFQCTTTNEQWDDGYYIGRTGKFHWLVDPIPYKGFQGFRYAPDKWGQQPTNSNFSINMVTNPKDFIK